MNQRNKLNPNFPIILIILTLLLASLACGLDFGNSDNDAESLQLEQTRVALQQTQIALDAIAQEPPTEEPVVVTEEPDEPVVQPDVSYEGYGAEKGSRDSEIERGADGNAVHRARLRNDIVERD